MIPYVFFGTPDFAAIILEKLIRSDMAPSVLVCNPDRPVGRKQILTFPPTKKIIQELESRNNELSVKVFQPENITELAALADKVFADNDFAVIAAYSTIIPQEVIDKARLGFVGAHPSLLPKLRGPSPIQSAILGGNEKTGTTLFIIDDKIDHGPILANKELGIRNQDYEELMRELAELSGELLVDTLPKFVSGNIEPEPQNHRDATYTKKFSSDDGYIDPKDLKKAQSGDNMMVTEIYRKIRALNPEPGVYTFMEEQRTKLLEAEIDGDSLKLTTIQREGKNPTKFQA